MERKEGVIEVKFKLRESVHKKVRKVSKDLGEHTGTFFRRAVRNELIRLGYRVVREKTGLWHHKEPDNKKDNRKLEDYFTGVGGDEPHQPDREPSYHIPLTPN